MAPVRKLVGGVAAAFVLLALAGCGDDEASGRLVEQTAVNGEVFNSADVDFATAMIPHHAQALVMVDLTRGRDLSPEMTELTEAILAAQGPEIEQMVDWLTGWGEPVPETMRDHANAGHGTDHEMGGVDADMPGMMTSEQLDELEATTGPEFETAWLEMMIEHHQGAIDMARDQQRDGTYGPALELAESIERSQLAEIDRMEKLLG